MRKKERETETERETKRERERERKRERESKEEKRYVFVNLPLLQLLRKKIELHPNKHNK